MKRLILLTAAVGVIGLVSVLLLRGGPGGVPVQAQEPSPPPAPAEQLAQAEQLRFQLKWDDATALLRQVVGRQAEDRASAATAQVRLGKYLLDRSRPDEAEPELNQVLAGFADQPEAVFWARMYLIDVARGLGRQPEALTVAERLVDDARLPAVQHAWAVVKHAELQLEQGLRGPATEELQQVVSSTAQGCDEPRNWARVRLAETAMFNWSSNEAIAICDAIIADHATGKANDEQAAWGLIWKGRTHRQSKQYVQSIEALQMAIALAHGKYPPVAFDAEFELGEVQRVSDEHEPALATYHAALERAISHNLPEDKADLARLQVGSEMRHLGMRERGIAWLRMGLEDPANLTGTDQLLAQRMVSFMSDSEAEAWQHYLVAPAQNIDPTQAMVQAEFKKPVPGASSTVANEPFLRLHWLGRLYEKQGRYQEAMTVHQQSLAQANMPDCQAEGLLGQARAARYLARQHRLRGRFAEYQIAKPVMIQTAEAASSAWTQVAATAKPGDSHYAMEQAVTVLHNAGEDGRALEVAEDLVNQFGPQDHPSKPAFARYMRMQALAWNGQYLQAATEGRAIDQDCAQFPDANLQEIRVSSLVRASLYSAQVGELAAGLAILDEIESRYPQQYRECVSRFRQLCETTVPGID